MDTKLTREEKQHFTITYVSGLIRVIPALEEFFCACQVAGSFIFYNVKRAVGAAYFCSINGPFLMKQNRIPQTREIHNPIEKWCTIRAPPKP